MSTPSVNMLRREALSRNLTGNVADSFVFGTLNKLRRPQIKAPFKQRLQPIISTGIPGVRKGRRVSLKALMAPEGV